MSIERQKLLMEQHGLDWLAELIRQFSILLRQMEQKAIAKQELRKTMPTQTSVVAGRVNKAALRQSDGKSCVSDHKMRKPALLRLVLRCLYHAFIVGFRNNPESELYASQWMVRMIDEINADTGATEMLTALVDENKILQAQFSNSHIGLFLREIKQYGFDAKVHGLNWIP